MAEPQKKPADQNNKRKRVSENAENTNKKWSVVDLVGSMATTTSTRVPAAPSPVAKTKPFAVVKPAAAVTNPVVTMAPSPVSMAKPPISVVKPTAATVAVTGPLSTMGAAPTAPSPVAMKTPTPAAPSPVAMKTPTPAAPSPVAMKTPTPAAPSPVATKTPTPAEPKPNAVAGKAPAPAAPISAVVLNQPAAVKHEAQDGGLLKVDDEAAGAMVTMAPAEEEAVNLKVKKEWLHCAACPAPLKRPVFMCGNGHVVCCACGGNGNGNGDGGENKHCDLCGGATTYARIRYMDGLVAAYKVPCPYKSLGCTRTITYHSAADHKTRCAHAPCYCLECSFRGSPASLLRHLTEESGRHRWPKEKIKYQTSRALVVPSSEHRLLLVAEEDDRVFLLAVGAGRGAAGVCPVTVVCVRGHVDADVRPLYTGMLWVDGPTVAAGHLRGSFQLKGDVANCGVPGEVDMEHGLLHAHVNPEMLHGTSKEIHLRICITKFM